MVHGANAKDITDSHSLNLDLFLISLPLNPWPHPFSSCQVQTQQCTNFNFSRSQTCKPLTQQENLNKTTGSSSEDQMKFKQSSNPRANSSFHKPSICSPIANLGLYTPQKAGQSDLQWIYSSPGSSTQHPISFIRAHVGRSWWSYRPTRAVRSMAMWYRVSGRRESWRREVWHWREPSRPTRGGWFKTCWHEFRSDRWGLRCQNHSGSKRGLSFFCTGGGAVCAEDTSHLD